MPIIGKLFGFVELFIRRIRDEGYNKFYMDKKVFLQDDHRIFVSDIIKQSVKNGLRVDSLEILFFGIDDLMPDEDLFFKIKTIIKEFNEYGVFVAIYSSTEEVKEVSTCFRTLESLTTQRIQVDDHRLPLRKQGFDIVFDIRSNNKDKSFDLNKIVRDKGVLIELA